ncbi:MAG: hypothetical protein EP348_01805 [Alphaproteobacteria bacterium]|nr:MAG: hypothetical protein EP348_01805 [Alphaproteobacteria bacterium]
MTDAGKITDKEIEAFVDGELSGAEARAVAAHILRSSEAEHRYAELLWQRAALKRWWKAGRRQ